MGLSTSFPPLIHGTTLKMFGQMHRIRPIFEMVGVIFEGCLKKICTTEVAF